MIETESKTSRESSLYVINFIFVANVYFWNYNYANASCWSSDIGSKKTLLSSHIEEITRTRLGIQPAEETEKFCYCKS